jgi:hypothetical protein
MAAALSVQSPFSRVPLGKNDITVTRRPLESEHGDPFTLLNAFEEWVELKSGGGSTSSHQWCRRRGLEQQRFYEMAKLRQQFQEILQASCFTFNSLLSTLSVYSGTPLSL